jgi:acyl-CoA synthetase (AMP-forming)/AMP-acid ligase II
VIAGAALRRALDDAGGRRLLIGDDAVLTGAQLNAAIDSLAAALQRSSPPSARIGVWFGNSVHALVAHLAVQRAGRTRLCVDPGAAPAEARGVFEAGNCHLVVSDAEHAPGVGGDVLIYGPDDRPDVGSTPEPVTVDPDQIELLYPRTIVGADLYAIPISFANWAAYIELNTRMWTNGGYGHPVDSDDVFLTVQQLMHGTGFIGTIPFLHMGLPQVIQRSFAAESVLDAVHRHGATSTFMVPGMLTRLAEIQDGQPGLQRIVYGGAPIAAGELLHAIRATAAQLTQVYGRLEGGWPLTTLGPADHARMADGETDLANSCGTAVAGIELGVRPVSGRDGLGELRVRSELVSPAFRDPDGWCSLGDLASRDETGYLRLHGRLDGMINTGSYHVYPGEVENAIRETLPVRDVAVSGEPHERWGEAVSATLTWPPGIQPPTDAELRSRLRQRLAHYKIPTTYHHREVAASGNA